MAKKKEKLAGLTEAEEIAARNLAVNPVENSEENTSEESVSQATISNPPQEEKKKAPEKEAKDKYKIYTKKYGDQMVATNDFIENIIESSTRLLIPILFILMFIPVVSIIAQALFLVNFTVFMMASNEWKDEFKNAANKSVKVEEAKFKAQQESAQEELPTQIRTINSELSQNISEVKEKINKQREISAENDAELAELKRQIALSNSALSADADPSHEPEHSSSM